MFDRLGTFVSRHWALVLLGWAAVLAGVFFFAPRWDDVTKDGDFEYLPDYCSVVKGDRLLADAFPQLRARSSIVFVLSRPDGPLTDADRALADRIAEKFKRQESAEGPIIRVLGHRTEAVGEKLVSKVGPHGQGLLVVLQVNREFMALDNMKLMQDVFAAIEEIRREQGIPEGLEMGVSGSAAIGADMRFANVESLRNTEKATIILVVVILVLVYRAPGLVIVPVATVAVSVVAATGLVALLADGASRVDWSSYMIFKTTRIFVVVILFGAGVDFCLFIIARYKEELGRGLEPGEAIARALGRVGEALAASALTTIVGLGLMYFSEFGKFRNSGPTVALCLVVALAASLTLAPALLRAAGRIVFWPWGVAPPAGEDEKRQADSGDRRSLRALIGGAVFATVWDRIARGIVRRPGLILVGSLMLLLPLCYRGFHIEGPTYDFLSELDEDRPSVQGTRMLRRHFAAGQTSPVTVLAYHEKGGLGADRALYRRIRPLTDGLHQLQYEQSDGKTVRPIKGVSSLYAPLGDPSEGGGSSVIRRTLLRRNALVRRIYLANAPAYKGKVTRFDLVLEYDPFSIESVQLLNHIEDYLNELAADPESEWHGAEFYFHGTTAGMRDLRAVTTTDQWRIQRLVPLGVLAILVLILRRPMISVYLICSVLVGYFVTLGVADALFGYLHGPGYHGLDWKVPVFLFVILIAVGQDYNIYLATRVFEEQKRHGLSEGLRIALVRTGGIITSCGVIMAGTFASMSTGSLAAMRQLGFALAFGVLLDTFVIRTILVPAFLIMWQRGLARWGIVRAPVPEGGGPAAALQGASRTAVPAPLGLGSGDGEGRPATAAPAGQSAGDGSAAAANRNAAEDASPAEKSSPRRWAPRMWLGCDIRAWTRLLVHNRFAIGPSYWYIAAVDTIASLVNTGLGVPQKLWYGRRIARHEIEEPPVFIIGHWRTGTTLLHELMAMDPQNAVPTTYECFAPHHFLVTERVATRLLRFMMPQRRPMDDMPTGWDRPQEDEFGLCIMGLPSPYLTIAFPNRPPQHEEYVDLERVDGPALDRWKQTFLQFLKQVALRNPGKRLVLKSPPHTCRIKVIQELFPKARFVNLVRDPYVLFPSTVNLWKSLYRTQGLQRPNFEGLEEHVLHTFSRMHDRLEQTRPLVEPSRFFDLRYEDLVTDPVGAVRALYEHLGLEGFAELRPRLEERAAAIAQYRPNRYDLTPEQRAEVGRRWAPYFHRYGYPMEQGIPANSLQREDVSCS